MSHQSFSVKNEREQENEERIIEKVIWTNTGDDQTYIFGILLYAVM